MEQRDENARETLENNSGTVVERKRKEAKRKNKGRRFSLVENSTTQNTEQIPARNPDNPVYFRQDILNPSNPTVPAVEPSQKESAEEIEGKIRYLERISNARVSPVIPSHVPSDHFRQMTLEYLDIKIAAVLQSFAEIMKERFDLVNSYCDTTFEPIVFNSKKKRWKINVGHDYDALDYVVCYINPVQLGNRNDGIEDHWHYVGFGLSDVYGNGFYYPVQPNPATGKSGFGFELSFRLRFDVKEMVNGQPPDWPVILLQKVAAYVCATGGVLAPGDHITWNSPLDCKESTITQMVITTDYSIPTLSTSTGVVDVFQIVGLTSDEVEVVQNWHALSLLNLFKTYPGMGGQALVTNIRRQASIFTLYPEVKKLVLAGIKRDGSNLSGVTSKILWTERCLMRTEGYPVDLLSVKDGEGVAACQSGFRRTLNLTDDLFGGDVCRLANMFSDFSLNGHSENLKDSGSARGSNIVYYDTIHLTMDPEAALILPLAMSGRVDHNRHFTFKSWKSDMAVTFVPELLPGSFATKDHPYAAKGEWLHVMLSKPNRDQIVHEITSFFQQPNLTYPKLLLIESARFAISIQAYILG